MHGITLREYRQRISRATQASCYSNKLSAIEENGTGGTLDVVESESCSSSSDDTFKPQYNLDRNNTNHVPENSRFENVIYGVKATPQRYTPRMRLANGIKREECKRCERRVLAGGSFRPNKKFSHDFRETHRFDYHSDNWTRVNGDRHLVQPNFACMNHGLLLVPQTCCDRYKYLEAFRRSERARLIRVSENGWAMKSSNIDYDNERPTSISSMEQSTSDNAKVYFRFSKGIAGEPMSLDYFQNEAFLVDFQAHCRGYLARRNYEELLKKDHQVRIIQRNCERIFNPWLRLLLALRPLLKCNRVEEELMYLKSELERYKTLVKMLRFENAEYQAKVANLLELIEQINTRGSESAVVNDLIKQISDTLTKNQEFWQEMAANNKALQSTILPKPMINGVCDGSPMTPGSPMTRLRNDADFYRNQVEVLKEEADEQQYRTSEHFQGQVSVLTNRLENLQHLLALESNKNDKLTSELEEKTNALNDARNYERNLEHIVGQLSKQLEQKNRANEGAQLLAPPTPTTPTGVQTEACNEEMLKELNTYRQLVAELRGHLSTNPKAMTILADTPFQPGGTYDLFQDPHTIPNITIHLDPNVQHAPLAVPPSPDYEQHEKFKAQIAEEIAELKRQLANADHATRESEERMRTEIEDREIIESENRQLQNRVAALDRELRCMRDEFEDSLNRRELLHQREMKELNDQLDEEVRKSNRLMQQNKDMDRELIELRNANDADDNILNDEWESMKSKLKADILYYKRSFEALQEEFDQYRQEHNTKEAENQLAERNERINVLEREQQQWRIEMDVQQVKLQNTTNLLEDAEKRLKQATRERNLQLHRISQLESERDAAIREAATVTGRATAEKEHTAVKLREYEELKAERDALRKELVETKQTLAGCNAEIAAEKRQAQARLKDLTAHQETRVADLKAELERTRDEVERLQAELHSVQASEAEHKSAKQQGRWRISELEDQLSHSLHRISNLERHNADLDAELVRAKADLNAAREATNLLKAARTRAADEWVQSSATGEDTDEDANKSYTVGAGKTEYGIDTFSEDSASNNIYRRNRQGCSTPRSGAHYQSNPAIHRSLPINPRSLSVSGRSSFRRSSNNILDEDDNPFRTRSPFRPRETRRNPIIIRDLNYNNISDSETKTKQEAPQTNVLDATQESDTIEDTEAQIST